MKYLLLILLAFYCFSCKVIERKLYSPTEINNPSLQKKGDYSLTASLGAPAGFDVNGGYAITKNIAIIAGGYSYKNRDTELAYSLLSDQRDSSILIYTHKGYHGGIGMFIPFNTTKHPAFASFYFGLINGTFKMNESFYETAPVRSNVKINNYTSNLSRWFVQAGINWYRPMTHHSLITRVNFVKYSNVVTDYSSNDQFSILLPGISYPASSSFIDIGYTARIFFTKQQRLGVQLALVNTGRLNRQDFNFYIQNSRASIGLIFKSPLKSK